MMNGLPQRPTRRWRKKIGPRDVNLIAMAMVVMNGSAQQSASSEMTTSNVRFAGEYAACEGSGISMASGAAGAGA